MKKISTTAIHSGNEPNFKEGGSGDVTVPIHLSTTFARQKVSEPTQGYEYSRSGNPTRLALETNLAALEGGTAAFAYASGLAAITNILMLLKPGDHVVSIDDVYGGTRRLMTQVFTGLGLEFTFADFSNDAGLMPYLKPNTRMIWIETPTNPLLKIVDIAAVAKAAKSRDLTLVVDNTFATPYFQRPLSLGADIVAHSLTKYLGGHTDVVGGAAITQDIQLAERLKFLQNAVGAILSPFDSYSVLRGIKTLPLRMRQSAENATRIIHFLKTNLHVKKIFYPGLAEHPGHEIAYRQMTGYGSVVSIELQGNLDTTIEFLERLKLFAIAESLGAVESLVCHPASMTHASVPETERAKIGISDTLVRLSIGIEDADDLMADLLQAFQAK